MTSPVVASTTTSSSFSSPAIVSPAIVSAAVSAARAATQATVVTSVDSMDTLESSTEAAQAVEGLPMQVDGASDEFPLQVSICWSHGVALKIEAEIVFFFFVQVFDLMHLCAKYLATHRDNLQNRLPREGCRAPSML